MIRILFEKRVVYRAAEGRRRGRLTRATAYRDAAWAAYKTKYAAELSCCCDGGPENCGSLLHNLFPAPPVIDRLARWLMWRDRRLAEIGASS